ncbi:MULTISPECIES: serine hydrolase domain-containing protein [Stenotrophomonas]|uniref:serine hydrolase domain-containing protein n=1 Tax=Stenotrophomonas TaxID=40323 RepID=UPI001CF3923C|nr:MULTISPECIES: serine hydrolase domain-containing protein [Stenotrophomonas]MCA7022649.1 beta-lactamase family protein [Stenotrophomonas acidaminiphila]MCE4075089.1 beta-lactamase family protein [Stenotrophomonas acidaminiphila]WHL17598.1 serine hydrolase domain-containing protein [Stenotrophomonas acidaminiphila]
MLAAACIAPAGARDDDRWQRLDGFLQDSTGSGRFPGAVALVEHRGRIVFHGRWGHADSAGTRPLHEDAIFRIYSMTKPVTSVAVLMLMEEGRLALDDPLSRYLPAFADRQVVVGGDARHPQLAPSPRAITLRHLLTHTSGLAADSAAHPVATGLLDAAGIDAATSLEDVAARLATLPLADAPGTHFHYEGSNTELLARVVEVVSGQPFAQFLQQRIFDPLAMRDTGFVVPAAQRGRVVELPIGTDDGRLRVAGTPSALSPGVRLKGYDSGAGGLYSTAADYLAFARMLRDDGRAGGRRLLARKTVDLMMADQLGGFVPAVPGPAPGEGFGLGGYVVVDPAARGKLGSAGQFGWSGAASTYFAIDRRERLVAILMLQYLPAGPRPLASPSTRFYNLVYQAIP